MVTKAELENGLTRVVAKYEELKSTWSFRRFNKTIQFVYPDLDLSYVMEIAGPEGVKEIKEGTVPRPNVSVILDSDTFLGILNQEIEALSAYGAGKIKFKGAMVDLLKLKKLL